MDPTSCLYVIAAAATNRGKKTKDDGLSLEPPSPSLLRLLFSAFSNFQSFFFFFGDSAVFRDLVTVPES